MTFNSVQYLIFLPVVVLVYYLLPVKIRWIWLLAASVYAYMSWNPVLILLIFGTTAVSWLCARRIAASENPKHRKFWLAAALIFCLGMLIYFKYTNFILENVAAVLRFFGVPAETVRLDLVLPAGISFYTFQTLSYTIDVYRRTVRPEKNPGHYALFVTFFPQLVAGPIERPDRLLPQFFQDHRPEPENFRAGVRLLLSGFFRKCVIADLCGVYVDQVFENPEAADGLAILAAGALFVVQVYCDFAGYSEIAAGSARLLGIRLMKNFDCPLRAVSIRDLMRRWHISLNTWFRDYVYIPLGGNRRGPFRRFINVMLVYFLCGLWHGASWTYVLWGVYVGFFLTVEGWLRPGYRRFCTLHGIDNRRPAIVWIRRCLTFLFFVPAALFFRAQSLAQIGIIFSRIGATWKNPDLSAAMASLGMDGRDVLCLLAGFLCLSLLPEWTEEKKQKTDGKIRGAKITGSRETVCAGAPGNREAFPAEKCIFSGKALAALCFLLAISIGWLLLAGESQVSQFVYFQF